jgi:basic amino acid/polyamine antiporter, APA family
LHRTTGDTLLRALGPIAAISVVISNVIGQGIFLKTRVMTCNVSSPGLVLLVWVLAGLLSLAGALTYAELGAMMPAAGGEYRYLKRAYGEKIGFLFGWMQFLVAKTGSQAALAVGFAIFLNPLLNGALNSEIFSLQVSEYRLTFSALQATALSIILLITLINCAAVTFSGQVATFLTVIKILLVVIIALGALLFATGDFSHLLETGSGSCDGVYVRGGLAGFGAAMLAALWAYDGWNNVTMLGEEIRDPEKNLPLSLIYGMVLVCALYLGANMAYFYVLSPQEIANIPSSASVATEVAKRFLGPAALTLMAVGLIFSTVGTLHTSMLTGSRIIFATTRDQDALKSAARVSSTHVPVRALLVQSLWASILALSGSYDLLTDYVVFASWIFYGLTAASVFILRRSMPDHPRPYKVWGYPLLPLLFILSTSALLINTLWTSPLQSTLGLVLIATGIPVYWYARRSS